MAGRREKPIRSDVALGVRRFAERLRQVREASGLTYREVAERSGVSTATVSRAASGVFVPGERVLLAVAGALDLQEEERAELVELRCDAEREEGVGRGRVVFPPDAQRLLHETLVQLYEAVGRPSLRTVEELSGIPRSTVHRCLTDWRDSSERKHQVARALMRLIAPSRRGASLEVFPSQVPAESGEGGRRA